MEVEYGGMEASDLKRIKELEAENSKLRRHAKGSKRPLKQRSENNKQNKNPRLSTGVLV